MYHNLKDGPNTNLKGEIGEIIAKHHLDSVFSTKEYWHNIVEKFDLSLNQKEFIKTNWKSFDLVDLKSRIIYEVKTRKFFNNKLKGVKNKIVITPNFSRLCDEAKNLGLCVKVFEITLYKDWRYGFNIKDFNHHDFWVHRPRPCGWIRSMQKTKTTR